MPPSSFSFAECAAAAPIVAKEEEDEEDDDANADREASRSRFIPCLLYVYIKYIYKYSPQRKVSSQNRIKEAPPYRARNSFSFSSKEVNAFVFLLLRSLYYTNKDYPERVYALRRAAFCGRVKLKKEYPLCTQGYPLGTQRLLFESPLRTETRKKE